ncbi:Hypothetical predicted protein [Olea europaea subsp. europaea]|uniref:Uncharacterized protein n=1 Tax=Olea europaea subsp. europaea TaxID=158383 RepID=A0A8S0V2J7_OLEEU|nr:Hypothetical predicted protein [Olea europaea subsp. europaea]
MFFSHFLVSKCRPRFEQSQFSETLSILHNSKKIRILESASDLSRIESLPELRYLETSSKLTSSIGRLQNLEFLLAERTTNILPRYLLNLPKLRHLHVGGPAKFSKTCESSRTNSLQTLSFICIFDSKDEEILRCSPNLRSLNCAVLAKKCPDLNFLSQLESLKIVFYGSFKGDYTVPNFPMNIKKLTLSNLGLPWKKMSLIGTLPKLEILKLEDEAFEGEVWNTMDEEFQNLKFLKLDNLDLEQWNSSYDHFPVLEQLVLRYCDNLEMIPSELGEIPTLYKIEVHACGINVENSAMQIRKNKWNTATAGDGEVVVEEGGYEEDVDLVFGLRERSRMTRECHDSDDAFHFVDFDFSIPDRSSFTDRFATGLTEWIEWTEIEELLSCYWLFTGLLLVRWQSIPSLPYNAMFTLSNTSFGHNPFRGLPMNRTSTSFVTAHRAYGSLPQPNLPWPPLPLVR